MTIVLTLLIAGCAGTAATTTAVPQASGPSEQVTLFTHCGFYEAEFDGDLWTPASIDRGAYPEGTGFNATTGTMTRDGDKALFETDTGLAIVFELAPPDLPPPPPCD